MVKKIRHTQEQLEKVQLLIDELGKAFADLEGVEYKIIIESYDENDDYVLAAEDSNNWDRSWC